MLRGTVTPLDWLRNLSAWVEPIHHDNLGPVHASFYSGMRTVQRELTEIVPSGPLIICGHSLGAARAVILSALLTIDHREPIARIWRAAGRVCPARTDPRPDQAPAQLRTHYGNDHDLITDLPFFWPPLFAYEHPTDLTDLAVTPMPDTPWVFRFHVPELYAGATPATPII